jgi:glutathione peroxidase
MTRYFSFSIIAAVLTLGGCSANASEKAAPPGKPLDFVVEDIAGKPVDLKSFRGSPVLIVNVASECGYTPQYAELQQLYTKYKEKGMVVVGFPSNDYGGQEPKDGAAILKFASDEYGVTFPLMAKVHTSGKEITPLYAALTAQKGDVKWNFTKFLVDSKGVVVAKFDSGVAPLSPELTGAIDRLLPPKT